MPIIEIDDQYAAELAKSGVPLKDRTADMRRASEFERFHQEIAAGANRRDLLLLMKKQYPHLAVPEIDAAVPVNEEIQGLRKEFEEYRESVAKERKEREDTDRESRAKGSVADGQRYLRQQGCDDEGVEGVETLMRERNLPDYEAAFALWSRNQPKPDTLPSGAYGGQALDWFTAAEDAPDHQLLIDNPVAFKNAEVRKYFQQRAEGRLSQ